MGDERLGHILFFWHLLHLYNTLHIISTKKSQKHYNQRFRICRFSSLVWHKFNSQSHLDNSSLATGLAASSAESRKRSKYAELSSSGNYIFAPIAIETHGAWGPFALEICADLGGRIAQHTGDARATAFLKQRLDIAIQRGGGGGAMRLQWWARWLRAILQA